MHPHDSLILSPTFPHFLSLKIVERDLVNRFVNCAKMLTCIYILYVQMKFIYKLIQKKVPGFINYNKNGLIRQHLPELPN